MSVDLDRRTNSPRARKARKESFSNGAIRLLTQNGWTVKVHQMYSAKPPRCKTTTLEVTAPNGYSTTLSGGAMTVFRLALELGRAPESSQEGAGEWDDLAEFTVRVPSAHGSSNSLETAAPQGSYRARLVINGEPIERPGTLDNFPGNIDKFKADLAEAGVLVRDLPNGAGWVAATSLCEEYYRLSGEKIVAESRMRPVAPQARAQAPQEGQSVAKKQGVVQRAVAALKKAVTPPAKTPSHPVVENDNTPFAVFVAVQAPGFKTPITIHRLHASGNVTQRPAGKEYEGITMTQFRYRAMRKGWVVDNQGRCRSPEEGLRFVRA